MAIEDYSVRDYNSWLVRLKDLAGKWFTDKEGRSLWTDFTTRTVENTILKMMAFYGDAQSFMRDNFIGETFGSTVRRKDNLLKIARLYKYDLPGPGYASVDVTLSIAAPDAADVLIPADTLLFIGNIQYYTTADATITAGDTSTTAGAKQVTHRTESIDSTNKTNQEVTLSYDGYVDDTMVVTSAAGTWTKVDNFLNSDDEDLHYKVFKDADFHPIIIFGDGVTGKVPEGTVTYVYDTTMGTTGRVTAGRLKGSITVVHGMGTKTVNFINAANSTGGTDGQGTGEARAFLPDYIRSSEKLVTRDDYETYARTFTAIARAFLLTPQEYPGVGANTGRLYLIAKGDELDDYTLAAAPTATNLSDVEDGVEDRGRLINFLLYVEAAPFITINVETTVYMDENYDEDEVADMIYANLRKYFAVLKPDGSSGEVQFGIDYRRDDDDESKGLFPWSHLFNVVRDTDGVEHISPAINDLLLNDYHEDVKIYLWQFPYLGTVKITNLVTSTEFNF